MDEKVSLEAISLYGDAYAEKVLKGFFASKDKITGSEILSLCNIQQVNLFVIRELFKVWRDETKKLKSPYFDFENAEVKEALDNFMGVLSKNISIDRAYFAPLLKKASSHALLVIFDPYDFYSITITGKNNKLDIEPFREEIKYLKVNKEPLERMLQKLEQRGIKEISGNEAFSVLDQILEEVNFTPEDIEGYIEKFSSVVPLDPSRFFIPKEEEKAPAPEKKHETPAPAPKPMATNQPKQAVTQTVKESFSKAPINEKLVQEKPAVKNFQKIARIKDGLTINQKFMFTKVLFHGDFELFSKAVDRLDQLDNLNAALKYIDDEYAATWDRDSEEFHEFMELVEKRFE